MIRVELYGLVMEGTGLTVYLWSPWRCTALEHRFFDLIKNTSGVEFEQGDDELRLHISDAKAWQQAVTGIERVLKGWQEDAVEGGVERRAWRWLLESDVDSNGYDSHGERSCVWMFLRLSTDRGGPGEPDRGEDIDLSGFGVCVWREE